MRGGSGPDPRLRVVTRPQACSTCCTVLVMIAVTGKTRWLQSTPVESMCRSAVAGASWVALGRSVGIALCRVRQSLPIQGIGFDITAGDSGSSGLCMPCFASVTRSARVVLWPRGQQSGSLSSDRSLVSRSTTRISIGGHAHRVRPRRGAGRPVGWARPSSARPAWWSQRRRQGVSLRQRSRRRRQCLGPCG